MNKKLKESGKEKSPLLRKSLSESSIIKPRNYSKIDKYMNASIKIWRYFSALVISAMGIAVSFLFLKPTSFQNQNAGLKPIANLVEKIELVEKKSSNGVQWQYLEVGDDLYQGEMIRTGKGSSAKVQFTENGSSIDIDPDSMVVIEQQKEKFSLNVLEGSLFVEKSEADTGGSEIELKSGDKTVSLSSGQLSISKRAGSDFEVNVLKGQAVAESAGKKVDLKKGMSAIVSKDIKRENLSLKVTYPSFGDTVFLKEGSPLKIRWVPFQGKYAIRVLRGMTKKQLSPINIPPLSPEKGEVDFPLGEGTFYWRLEAISNDKSQKGLKSPIFKNTLSLLRKPVLLEPNLSKEIEVLKTNFDLSFLWSASKGLKVFDFQIAKDSKFKNLIRDEKVEGLSFQIRKPLSSGRFFWRVKSTYPSGEQVISEVRDFKLTVKDLFPPKLIFPEANYKVFAQKNTQYDFEWEKIKGVREYVFRLERSGKEVLTRKTRKNRVSLKLKKLGNYFWRVASVDRKGKKSKFSNLRRFSLEKLPKLNFFNLKNKYFFTGDNFIKFEWGKVSENFKGEYKFRIWNDKGFNFNKTVSRNSYSVLLEKPGKYKIRVLAYDQFNKLISRSNTEDILISLAKQLDPPEIILPKNKDFLRAPVGSIRIQVKETENIKKYGIRIKDLRGATVFKKSSKQRSFQIDKLLPGKYNVEPIGIDNFDRKTEYGEGVELVVPEKSNIAAPKLKKIKVK